MGTGQAYIGARRWRKHHWYAWRVLLFSSFPATNSLASLSNPWNLRPSTSMSTLLLQLEINKNTIRCVGLHAKIPGHRQERLMQTLILSLLFKHLFLLFRKLGGPGSPFPSPSFRPPRTWGGSTLSSGSVERLWRPLLLGGHGTGVWLHMMALLPSGYVSLLGRHVTHI